MDWGDSSSGSSSLTVGERICAAFIPFIALVEVLIFAVGNCLDYKPRTTNKISPEYRDLARFADESPFTVNEVEALYELYKKLSNSIIKDGLIHKEELQLALFRTPHGENLFLDWASAQVHRPLADKASRALVLYGDGLARFVNSGHTHLHSLASKAACGFLSFPNAPPSESEDERIFRVCSSVAPSESCDDKSLQSNALLPTISERYF